MGNRLRDLAWQQEELREAVVPLLVLGRDIEKHTMIRPTAVMLPLSLAPDATKVFGLPVIRGDRAALIYEPQRSY